MSGSVTRREPVCPATCLAPVRCRRFSRGFTLRLWCPSCKLSLEAHGAVPAGDVAPCGAHFGRLRARRYVLGPLGPECLVGGALRIRTCIRFRQMVWGSSAGRASRSGESRGAPPGDMAIWPAMDPDSHRPGAQPSRRRAGFLTCHPRTPRYRAARAFEATGDFPPRTPKNRPGAMRRTPGRCLRLHVPMEAGWGGDMLPACRRFWRDTRYACGALRAS
jgi:hypothetical protein